MKTREPNFSEIRHTGTARLRNVCFLALNAGGQAGRPAKPRADQRDPHPYPLGPMAQLVRMVNAKPQELVRLLKVKSEAVSENSPAAAPAAG